MELSTITACKLFKTSNRQDKILANVANVCLSSGLRIQQAYQVNTDSLPDNLKSKERRDAGNELARENNLKEFDFKDSEKLHSSEKEEQDSAKNAKHRPMDMDSKTPAEYKPENSPADTLKNAPEHSLADSPKGLETDVVESSTCVSMPRIDVTERMDVEVEDIKGILNADADTCGANRVRSKDGEVWVYYSDNVNLNDVMVDVIETLNRAGYAYLEFNRLARSDNAVVFVIIDEDTERQKKPEQQTNSEG